MVSARRWPLVAAMIAAWTLSGPAAGAADPRILRVCGDPDNLPFSNRLTEGFENKIAELIARDLGLTLEYYWWPHQRGLVRNTLGAGACDVLISIPTGYDLVLWTRPYYRSAYVLAQLGHRPRITSLDDPGLKGLKIGAHAGTPPYDALAERGLSANLVVYSLFFDPRIPDAARRPTRLLEDVLTGELDVAAAWGPVAGYFAKLKAPGATLSLRPLHDDRIVPMTFEFSMGVRKGNAALQRALEEAIDRRRAEVEKILDDYGVPRLPLGPASPAGQAQRGKAPDPPGHHRHQP
jgi:mxaJ protein